MKKASGIFNVFTGMDGRTNTEMDDKESNIYSVKNQEDWNRIDSPEKIQ